VKIAVFSDLHIEFGQATTLNCSNADIIILAGDCHRGNGIIEFAAKLREQFRVPVLVVAGNQEFYGSNYQDTLLSLRASAKKSSVSFLENDTLIYNDIRFFGCTLWTDFCLYGKDKQNIFGCVADKFISDFWKIEFKNRSFMSRDAISLFEQSYAWLQEGLARPFAGKTVVVTHFAPHIAAIPSNYPKDDPISPYFASDCSPLINEHSIHLWIYGHTHNSRDVILENGTRLVSNQKGYPSEPSSHTKFSTEKVLEI